MGRSSWWFCRACGGWEYQHVTSCRKCGASSPKWQGRRPWDQSKNGPWGAAGTAPDGQGFYNVPRSKSARKRAARAAKQAAEQRQGDAAQEPVQDNSMMDVEDEDSGEESEVHMSREGLVSKLKRLEGAQKLLKEDTPVALREHLEAAIAAVRQQVRKVEPAPTRLKSLQTGVERRKLRLQKIRTKLESTAREMSGLEETLESKLAEVRAEFRAKRVALATLMEELTTQQETALEGL
eukprot:3870442-Amphidinium_carterae.1